MAGFPTTLVLLILFVACSSSLSRAFDCHLGMSLVSKDQNSGNALREMCESECYTYLTIPKDLADDRNKFANDINYCQSKGVKVLLSIEQPLLPSLPEVTALLLSILYLNPKTSKSYTLDGINFAFTNGSDDYYHKLALALKKYSNEAILSALPGCAYPSPYFNSAINDGLFDVIWPKFYNDKSCDYSGGIVGVVSAWKKWDESIPANTKLLYGLPTSPEGVESGYMPPTVFANNVLPNIRHTKRYAGAMLQNLENQVNNLYASEIAKPVCDYTREVKCHAGNKGLFISHVKWFE